MNRDAYSRYGEKLDGVPARLAPLDRALQIIVPKAVHIEILVLKLQSGRARHLGVNKMSSSLRRTCFCDSMISDVYAFVTQRPDCAKGRAQGRHQTKLLLLFPATELFKDMCLALFGALPKTRDGNWFLLVIVYRFATLTGMVPVGHEDAETVVPALLDTLVASYGPLETLLTDNGPQLTSVNYGTVRGMLGIGHTSSTNYHPQTQRELEE